MDALPPDPYLALGLAKDATATAIKQQYRKLVLKCHPDKIQDEALKQDAADKFHRIQSAYEVVGDEDRRARYDAQCKLLELRREVMERGGGGTPRGGVDVRTASYRMPTESRGGEFYARGPERYERVSPQYEERWPGYAADDYFDHQPRTAARKYDEYERSSKRSPPKEERPKTKTSTREAKETERSSRKEKSRRTEKDVRKERERKAAYATVQDPSSSDSDPYERESRRMRAEDEERRRQEKIARDIYLETERKQKEEAEMGAYGSSAWTRRMQNTTSMAEDYIARTRDTTARPRPESERRPSPVRHQSSKDKVESLKRSESKQQPGFFRRGSGPIKTSRRDTGKSSREKEREPEIVDEPVRETRRTEARDGKRPPGLNSTKSAPENIRPSFERQRSYSMQEDPVEPTIPHMKRSETMPTPPAAAAPSREARGRKESSRLRPEEAYATPERTPEPEARPAKYRYGREQEYADDVEVPTPDGYRTEVREPSDERRYTRSPSPIKDRERDRPSRTERQRPSSARHATAPQPPPLPRTTSTQYVYPSAAREDSYSRPSVSREESYSRPSVSRENSKHLYGEIKNSGSPSPRYTYSPPPERVSTSRRYGPEDVKFQTGYSTRPDKPTTSRHNSGRQAVYVS